MTLVNEGDRIAQLILEKIETSAVLEVDVGSKIPFSENHSYVSFRTWKRLYEVLEDSAQLEGILASKLPGHLHQTTLESAIYELQALGYECDGNLMCATSQSQVGCK